MNMQVTPDSITTDRFRDVVIQHVPRELLDQHHPARQGIGRVVPSIGRISIVQRGPSLAYAHAVSMQFPEQKFAVGVLSDEDGKLRWRNRCTACGEHTLWCRHTLALLDVTRCVVLRERGEPWRLISGARPPNWLIEDSAPPSRLAESILPASIDAVMKALVPTSVFEPEGAESQPEPAQPSSAPPQETQNAPADTMPQSAQTDSEVHAWLAQFMPFMTEAPARETEVRPLPEGRVVMLVTLDPVGKGVWTRLLVRPAFLPNDNVLRGKRLLALESPTPPATQSILAQLPTNERARLQAFRALSVGDTGKPGFGHVQGGLDHDLLYAWIADQRCFLDQSGDGVARALTVLPPRAPVLVWQTDSKGQRLTVEPDRGARRFVCANPPLLIDSIAGEVTPLTMPLALLEQLLTAPPVAEAEMAQFLLAWRPIAATHRLPSPDDDQIHLKQAAPRALALLKVIEVEGSQREWQRKHEKTLAITAFVSFKYGRGMVRCGATEQRVHVREDEALVAYDRDREAERVLEGHLIRAGLERCARIGRPRPKQPDFATEFFHRNDLRAQVAAIVKALVRTGIQVELSPAMGITMVEVDAETRYAAAAEVEGGKAFDLDVGVAVGGERVSLSGVVAALMADPAFHATSEDERDTAQELVAELPDGRLLRLSAIEARKIVAPVLEWIDYARASSDKPTRIRVPRAGVLAHAAERGQLPEGLAWPGGEQILAIADALRSAAVAPVPPTPMGFQGELRQYQQEGVRWLRALEIAGLGGILADDMGLGKTVQLLASIALSRHETPGQAPVLLVVPTSLVSNWISEARKFTPQLRVLALRGADRASRFAEIPESDLVITTYPLVWRDVNELKQHPYSACLLDEAGAVKNAASTTRDAITQLTTERTLIISGTPIENALTELWSFADLALPGLLGGKREFGKHYRSPIENGAGERRDEAQARLSRRIKPFILRRKKKDVATDLPEKTVAVRTIDLSERARASYDGLHTALSEEVRAVIAERGLAQSTICTLDALNKMQRFCCYPKLVLDGPRAQRLETDKLDLLLDMLAELVSEGRRILVFSQFVTFLEVIDQAVRDRGITTPIMLHGKTKNRDELVTQFQEGNAPIFLISLKAGGVGLNLTRADTVILASPWWNSAAEEQAEDRAYRIGQTNPVIVYKLITNATVEEHAMMISARKAALAASVLDDGMSTGGSLTEEDINLFFK